MTIHDNQPHTCEEEMVRLFCLIVVACSICVIPGCQEQSQSGSGLGDNSPVAGAVELQIEFNSDRKNIKLEVPCLEDSTVFTILEGAQNLGGLKFSSTGRSADMKFVTSIEGVDNLAAAGDNWVYRVNGQLGNTSSGLYPVKPGDQVVWVFGKYSEKDGL